MKKKVQKKLRGMTMGIIRKVWTRNRGHR